MGQWGRVARCGEQHALVPANRMARRLHTRVTTGPRGCNGVGGAWVGKRIYFI